MWIILGILAFSIFMCIYTIVNRKSLSAKRKERKEKAKDYELQAALDRREKHLHHMRTNPMYAREYARQLHEGQSVFKVAQDTKDTVLINKAIKDGKIPPMN